MMCYIMFTCALIVLLMSQMTLNYWILLSQLNQYFESKHFHVNVIYFYGANELVLPDSSGDAGLLCTCLYQSVEGSLVRNNRAVLSSLKTLQTPAKNNQWYPSVFDWPIFQNESSHVYIVPLPDLKMWQMQPQINSSSWQIAPCNYYFLLNGEAVCEALCTNIRCCWEGLWGHFQFKSTLK